MASQLSEGLSKKASLGKGHSRVGNINDQGQNREKQLELEGGFMGKI